MGYALCILDSVWGLLVRRMDIDVLQKKGLVGCNLVTYDLMGARGDLIGCDLVGCGLVGCDLGGAILCGVRSGAEVRSGGVRCCDLVVCVLWSGVRSGLGRDLVR